MRLVNGHYIEAKTAYEALPPAIGACQANQLPPLIEVHRAQGRVVVPAETAFHLDKHQNSTLPANQVQFPSTAREAVVPSHDCIPLAAKEPVGEFLTLAAQ